jgi:hypothetical protein
VALAVAGCGSSGHPNDPRPQVPTRVSVTLGPNGVIVQPTRIAFGPERNQQIPQNQNHAQPDINTDRPLDVVLVAANQTDTNATLYLHGQTDVESEPVLAHSPGTMRAELPTGTYTITASGIPYSHPAKLVVGPYRASSQNDVLQP